MDNENYLKGRKYEPSPVDESLGKGDIEGALSIASAIDDENDRALALKEIAVKLVAIDQAGDMIARAQDLALSRIAMDNICIGEHVLRLISNEYARRGNLDQAEFAVSQQLRPEVANQQYRSLAVVCASRGDVLNAKRIVRCSINEKWVQTQAQEAISIELAIRGDINQALDIAKSIDNDTDRDSAFWHISSELGQKGSDRAVEVAKLIVNPELQLSALRLLEWFKK